MLLRAKYAQQEAEKCGEAKIAVCLSKRIWTCISGVCYIMCLHVRCVSAAARGKDILTLSPSSRRSRAGCFVLQNLRLHMTSPRSEYVLYSITTSFTQPAR